MDPTLLASILISGAAAGWALRPRGAPRDRRFLLLAVLPGLMALCTLLLLLSPALRAALQDVPPWGAVLWLFVTVLVAAPALALPRLLAEHGQTRAALHETERTHTTLLSNLPGMAYRCRHDARWTMTFVSEGCRALTGYAPEDLIDNRTASFADLIHPDDRADVEGEVAAAVAEGRPFRLAYRLRTAGAEERWVWEQGRAVPHAGTYVLEGFITDITGMKRYEAELLEARHEAEELNRLKSALLANISHEIRTPLTSIIGFASLLAEEVAPKQGELVRHIEQSGQRLLETLNAMIDLSLIEAGSLDLYPEVLNLCTEAEAVVDRMAPKAAEKGLNLRFHADAPAIWAFLDHTHLERILHKLLDNAIKFTEHGRITVGVHQAAKHIEIRIADTGIGISPTFLPHLFEAFKQESTGSTRDYEGAGLGLALTKKLVDLLGGTIRVETEKGRGSTFIVTFPRHRHRAAHRTGGPRRSRGDLSGLALQTRVLVIDPSPMAPSSVALLLGQWCTIATAVDEAAALRLVRTQRFDLVLLNIDHQRSAGLETMEQLRGVVGRRRLAIIALTARPFTGEQGIFLDAGFDGYIGLPFTQPALPLYPSQTAG